MYIDRFDSGLTCYIDNNEYLTLFALIIKAGSVYEQKDKSGISHFLEHMHAFVAQNIPYDNMAALEPLNYAYTNFYETVYVFVKREVGNDTDFITRCRNTIGSIFNKNFLTEALFTKIKNDVLEEYKHTDFSKDSALKQLFYNEPYPLPIGELKCIQDLKYSDIISYHDKQYLIENAAVVVISNADKNFVIDSLSGQYANIKFDFLPFITSVPCKKFNINEDDSIYFLSKYKRVLESAEQYITDMLCLRFASDSLADIIYNYFIEKNIYVSASGLFEILSKHWHIFKLRINFNNPNEIPACLEYIIKNFTLTNKTFEKIKTAFSQELTAHPQGNSFHLLDEYINNFLFDEPIFNINDEINYIQSSLKRINFDMVVKKFNAILLNLVIFPKSYVEI